MTSTIPGLAARIFQHLLVPLHVLLIEGLLFFPFPWFSVIMATVDQVKRRQHIQVAEGYLSLAEMFEDTCPPSPGWPLSAERRRVLAERAIATLNEIRNPLGLKPQILYLKGQAHRIAGRLNLAIRCFRKSSNLDPDNLHTLLALAWCYKRTDDIDRAIEAMILSLRIEPESAIVHYNLSCYLALAHQSERALTHLVIALDLHPDYSKRIPHEQDFDPIRDLPRFREVTQVALQAGDGSPVRS
jgi:tetratricopeptide (TPR) repeat protein